MRIRIALALASVVVAAALVPWSQAAESTTDACRVMKETKITQEDIPSLRAAWIADDRYNPFIGLDPRFRSAFRELNDALAADQFAKAADICEKHYERYCMVILWTNRCWRAYDGLNRPDLAEPYQRASIGVGHYVITSGDGDSPASAYHVIDLLDQEFMYQVRGVAPTAQVSMTQDGHHYDVITATHEETGNEVTIYFNVDAMFSAYKRISEDGDKPE